ncbi:MAG: c-type cytochrome [Bacteriovoracia bacterium]
MKKLIFLTIIYSVCINLVAYGAGMDIEFKNHGRQVKTLTIEEIEKITPKKEITVYLIGENQKATFTGFEVNPLFDKALGSNWRTGEEVLFTCTDGYQPSVPVERFLMHKAYLVFERKNSNFQMVHEGKDTPLGPYYLVWENVHDPVLKTVKNDLGWPWSLTAVDIIDFKERFPNVAPAKNASLKVKNGFRAFQTNCSQCHSVNGQGGGGMGPELNYPVSATEYWHEKWLKKWMLDPQSIRFDAKMPPLDRSLEDRAQVASEIYEYLKHMAKHKKAPKK